MSTTVATLPIQENNAQYYQGQSIISTNGGLGGGTIFNFPNFNTTLISSYDSAGLQTSNNGNFALHILATATTLPSTANLITASTISVADVTNNTLKLAAQPANQFLFLQPSLKNI